MAYDDETPFARAVVNVLARLRPGEVTTYGEVAADAGFPGAARAVGSFLRTSGAGVPWWRVVRSDGRLAAGKIERQAELLAAEGVVVVAGRVRSQQGA